MEFINIEVTDLDGKTLNYSSKCKILSSIFIFTWKFSFLGWKVLLSVLNGLCIAD